MNEIESKATIVWCWFQRRGQDNSMGKHVSANGAVLQAELSSSGNALMVSSDPLIPCVSLTGPRMPDRSKILLLLECLQLMVFKESQHWMSRNSKEDPSPAIWVGTIQSIEAQREQRVEKGEDYLSSSSKLDVHLLPALGIRFLNSLWLWTNLLEKITHTTAPPGC